MKIYRKLILILIIAQLISCTKSENNLFLPLDGSWIEMLTRSDTIVFTQFGTDPAFELIRGLEKRSGYWLPKYGAGLYCFNITGDTIALQDLLSSTLDFENYYFKQTTSGSFEIGNFYNPAISRNEKIIFLRIK